MEPWEVTAREGIRDLVTRYNSNGDTGRFPQLMELFAPDAIMEIVGGRTYEGLDEIFTIFTGTKAHLSTHGGERPAYVRHFTATHQIDMIDESNATGRCYFSVLTPIGLDHWGRYTDEYRKVEGRWLFGRRKVQTEGQSPGSLFPPDLM